MPNQATAKRMYIESLKKEVRDFHPFLEKLFNSMVQKGALIKFDKTHGVNEVGADFVLTRKDDITESTDYIGVIVKVGSITKDLEEIERQISQCNVSRNDANGNVISIKDHWVITNGDISGNARREINEKFKNCKIEFFDVLSIINLCDKYMGNSWLNPLHSTNEYLKIRKNIFSEAMQRNSLIDIPEEYQFQRIILEKKSNYNKEPKKGEGIHKVNIIEYSKTKKMSIIDSGFGSGKTWLLNQIGYKLCQENIDMGMCIPVYTTFDSLCKKHNLSVDNLISEAVDDSVVKEVGTTVQYILLVDGVDEAGISDADKSEKICKLYESIESKNVNAVLASRNTAPLLKRQERLRSDCKVLEIQPLTTSQILKFILKVCQKEKISNRLLNDINSNDLMKDLAKIPITALILAQILKEDVRDLPSTLPELFAKYTELSLGRWDIEKGLLGQKEYEALDNILSNIADYMVDNDLSQIGETEAKIYFHNYVSTRNTGLDEERLYQLMLKKTGIVSVWDGFFSFKHRSIMEFIYAKDKAKNKSLPIEKKLLTLKWQTIYYFYFGCLKDCPEEINRFLNLQCEENIEQFMKIVSAPNFLLAAYNTPYDSIQNVVNEMLKSSGCLYLKLQKDASFPLLNYAEMNFLWFFQMVMRDCYSYNFLKRAIEEYLVEMDTNNMNDADKYTLFFISMIRASLKIEEPMDFLFAFRAKLPVQIQLGLFHEVKSEKNMSENAKVFMKKMGNKLKKGAFAEKSFLKTLYKTPLLNKMKKNEANGNENKTA